MITQVMIGLTADQIKWLKKESQQRGISRAEIIRRIVDEKREKPKTKG